MSSEAIHMIEFAVLTGGAIISVVFGACSIGRKVQHVVDSIHELDGTIKKETSKLWAKSERQQHDIDCLHCEISTLVSRLETNGEHNAQEKTVCSNGIRGCKCSG